MAQIIRPGSEPLQAPWKMEWTDREELRKVMLDGGFKEGKLEIYEKDAFYEGDDWDDLAERLKPGPIALAKAHGWSEEEVGRIEEVMKDVLKGYAGERDGKLKIPMMAYVAKCVK